MATKAAKQQEMFAQIEFWKNSGQNQVEFCKANDLAYSAFHYWYKKYRQQQGSEQSTAFIPVHLQGSANGSPLVELVLPDGRRLNFYQAVEVSFLRALLN